MLSKVSGFGVGSSPNHAARQGGIGRKFLSSEEVEISQYGFKSIIFYLPLGNFLDDSRREVDLRPFRVESSSSL